MFNNNVILKAGSGSPVTTVLLNGPSNGRTERAALDGSLRFSIAHQASNENRDVKTSRSVVRIERDFQVPDSTGVAKAYVQVVVSHPKDVGATPAVMLAMIEQLVTFFNWAENPLGEGTSLENADTITRLLAGEP